MSKPPFCNAIIKWAPSWRTAAGKVAVCQRYHQSVSRLKATATLQDQRYAAVFICVNGDRSRFQLSASPFSRGTFVCNCLENGYYFAIRHMLLWAGCVHVQMQSPIATACKARCETRGRKWHNRLSLNKPLLPALVWNYQICINWWKYKRKVSGCPIFPKLSGMQELYGRANRFASLSLYPSLSLCLFCVCCISFCDCSLLQSLYIICVESRRRIRLWCFWVCRCHGFAAPNSCKSERFVEGLAPKVQKDCFLMMTCCLLKCCQ